MSILRKIRTLTFIASRRPGAALDLINGRIERRLGISLFFLSLKRLSTYAFEVLNTHGVDGSLTQYGNYYLNASRLPPEPVIFSLGIGQDTTFDEAVLAKNTDAKLFMIDPTPSSKAYVDQKTWPSNMTFLPYAITDFDGEVELFTDDLHSEFEKTSSVSIFNRGFYAKGFKAPCRRITTLMAEVGVDRIDVLKMDIEGAGIRVLSDILASGIRPSQIACELERPQKLTDTVQFLREVNGLFETLKGLGYEMYRTRELDHGCQIEIVAVAEHARAG